MKKVLAVLTVIILLASTKCLAEEITLKPDQQVNNTKGFAGINYDRQDSEEVGVQKIVNDHSAFNINIQIIKKGALFCRPTVQDK